MVKIEASEQETGLDYLSMRQIGNAVARYIAQAVARDARGNFPVRVTGITAGAVEERKVAEGTYSVGVRAAPLKAAGRSAAYLGKLQEKYNYLHFLKKLVPKWRRKIVPGLLKAIEKKANMPKGKERRL